MKVRIRTVEAMSATIDAQLKERTVGGSKQVAKPPGN
jgi:hypothetical protein